MKILVDGMGGDNAPDAIVEGSIAATKNLSDRDEIIIIGQENLIEKSLASFGYNGNKISIVNSDEVITNDESPTKAVMRKKKSSIVIGMNMIKNGEGDVFISAGSTGALLAGGIFILGRIDGIDRPTLATIYPVIGKNPSLLVDTGANTDCKPRNILDFAIMGSIYMEKVMGRRNPTVGLVNNGTEPNKGTKLTKEAYKLLDGSSLNFIGNVEARDLQDGVCDIITTDGFTGNIIIKLSEGMALMALRELKSGFLSGTISKLGSALLSKQLKSLKTEFDYKEYGGAPILGVKGALLKMHGSSDAKAVEMTILKAIPYISEDVVGTIESEMAEIVENNIANELENY